MREVRVDIGEQVVVPVLGMPRAAWSAFRDVHDMTDEDDYAPDLMAACWEDCFRNVFDSDVEKFKARMTLINALRADAHPAEIADHDMSSFRGAMEWLEIKVAQFED